MNSKSSSEDETQNAFRARRVMLPKRFAVRTFLNLRSLMCKFDLSRPTAAGDQPRATALIAIKSERIKLLLSRGDGSMSQRQRLYWSALLFNLIKAPSCALCKFSQSGLTLVYAVNFENGTTGNRSICLLTLLL